MDSNQRLNLQKMMSEFDVVDQTSTIRKLKQSSKIKTEVDTILKIMEDNPNLSHNELDKLCISSCQLLFNQYTDIYNRLLKKELNLEILSEIINCLKKIEDGQCDQQEASFEVGSLLKKMYIDSALKKSEKIDKNEPVKKKSYKMINWKSYKNNINV